MRLRIVVVGWAHASFLVLGWAHAFFLVGISTVDGLTRRLRIGQAICTRPSVHLVRGWAAPHPKYDDSTATTTRKEAGPHPHRHNMKPHHMKAAC